MKDEFVRMEIKGNYNVVGDSLILDSHPQHDKMIVIESVKNNKNTVFISVTNKDEHPINYTLTIILENDSVETLKDQFLESKIRNKNVKAFYITDTNGLQSPVYRKRGKFVNCFKVLFETRRVFENEKWYISHSIIQPRGLNGTFENYHFTKQK